MFSAAALLPIALLLLLGQENGECISIDRPIVDGDRESRRYLPGVGYLSDVLTEEMKTLQPSSLVLGTGERSDSRLIIQARGVSDICVPSARLSLAVRCSTGECTATLSRTAIDQVWSSDARFALPVDARKLRASLSRLIEETLP